MTVTALVFSFGPPMADSNVAWAQCEETPKLLAWDGEFHDHFGAATRISGDVLIVGARNDENNGANSGSVYVYRESAGAWEFERKLTASDGANADAFGAAVAIDGDTIVIGALGVNGGGGGDFGAAYIFRYSQGTSTWFQEAKLMASDGTSGDMFGSAVAIEGDMIVIGAPGDTHDGTHAGSTYVFTRDNSENWQQEAKLLAEDPPSYKFGGAVAVAGGVVVIGAWADNDRGTNSGSVYVFGTNGSTWVQQQELFGANSHAFDEFGKAVAIDSATVIIGSPLDDDMGGNFGSAYIFRYNPNLPAGERWVEEAELYGSGAGSQSRFGFSVAVEGDAAFVGAYREGPYSLGPGAAYLFGNFAVPGEAPDWLEVDHLAPVDSVSDDKFGYSVDFSNNVGVVGAWGEISNTGATYVFRCASAPFDCTFDSDCDIADLALLLGAWGPYEPCPPFLPADFNQNCTVGAFDLAIVLGHWGP